MFTEIVMLLIINPSTAEEDGGVGVKAEEKDLAMQLMLGTISAW